MKKAIYEPSIGYELLHPVSAIATHSHYQRTVIRGRENLPREGSYIIAPCHQNALMEPMAMLATLPNRIVFLARADIFQKPAVNAFLTFLKILPVYRIRDGKSSLAKNEAIFAQSKQVLLNGVPLCLMAEGRHNDRHQLLPLVKGMFRIAGETQRELGDTPLYIVPTGIDFDHYEEPYSNLVVNIGKPIPVQPFMEQFEADEPVALNQMRERLAVALKQQMHHVESKEYYEEVYALCHILNPSWRKATHRRNSAWGRFATRCDIAQHYAAIVDVHAEQPDTAVTLAREYLTLCQRCGLDLRTATDPWHPVATLTATGAVAAAVVATVLFEPVSDTLLWMLLCNPIVLLPTHLLVRRLIKDPQFRSSVNYGIRLVLTLLYTIVITIVTVCCQGWGWGALALLTTLVVARANAIVHPFLRRWLRNLRRMATRCFHAADLRRMREIQKSLSDSTIAKRP